MLVKKKKKKTFYLVKPHKVKIPIHSKGMNFITHFIPKSFFGHAKTANYIHNSQKKKVKIIVKIYNILSNYIPITFTYPFHTQYKKSHVITHSKGMNYIPISLQFI